MRHDLIVRTLKTVMILVLVTLWVMASNHCRLEHIPALAFMTCCDHDDSAGSQDKDCEADGCAAVENQLYKADIFKFQQYLNNQKKNNLFLYLKFGSNNLFLLSKSSEVKRLLTEERSLLVFQDVNFLGDLVDEPGGVPSLLAKAVVNIDLEGRGLQKP